MSEHTVKALPLEPVPVTHDGPIQIANLVHVQQISSPEGTWTTALAPLFGQAVLPVQLLSSDNRRVRAVIISIDQDLYLANEQEQLQLGPSQAAPQGGYWPKGIPLEVRDAQDLWAYSAAAGPSKVTVHVESGYGLG
jgi:hypothetical protein